MTRLSILLVASLLLGACTGPSASVSPSASMPAMLANETPTATLRVGEEIGIWGAAGRAEFEVDAPELAEVIEVETSNAAPTGVAVRALAAGVATITARLSDGTVETYTVTITP